MKEFLVTYSTEINITSIIITVVSTAITLLSMAIAIKQANKAKGYADKISQTQTRDAFYRLGSEIGNLLKLVQGLPTQGVKRGYKLESEVIQLNNYFNNSFSNPVMKLGSNIYTLLDSTQNNFSEYQKQYQYLVKTKSTEKDLTDNLSELVSNMITNLQSVSHSISTSINKENTRV